jgi:class 3 adenylate cyclase
LVLETDRREEQVNVDAEQPLVRLASHRVRVPERAFSLDNPRVPRSAVTRRLATVFFLDIVGSTALATELGDARWRELLTRFRRVVRTELKRFGGREQDTAGDGFFATFAEPAQALRAAAAIARAVQQVGVDVRTGIHTGECEEIDGKLGGIAVHVGARVMSLAGPAEAFVTSTVRELVAGSGAKFEERGAHELKGVEGSWNLFALTAVEMPLPPPLTQAEAAERLSLLEPTRIAPRARLLLAGAALALIAIAVVGGLLALRGGAADKPIDMVRLDARTREVDTTIRGQVTGIGQWSNLLARDGTLWQYAGDPQAARLVARDAATGAPGATIQLGPDACGCRVTVGFGSVWVARPHTVLSGPHAGKTAWSVDRIDSVSRRKVETIPIRGNADVNTIAADNGSVWALRSDASLLRIDPDTNRVTRTWQTNADETYALIPLGGYQWICECQFQKVRRFDPRTGQSRTFKIPTEAYLIDAHGSKVWFLDPANATLTAMDPETGATDTPLGISGQPQQAVVAFGAMWVAAGRVVDRIDLSNRAKTDIAMPTHMWAGSIAADPESHSIWVGNSGRAPRANE